MIQSLHQIPTPYYLIDENKLLNNMKKIELLRQTSGAKVLLALKCFSTWSVFPLMRQYMDGATTSSLNEIKLAREEFGGEVHAYSVAYSESEFNQVHEYSDKIIFNSISQLKQFYDKLPENHNIPLGLRLNPQISCSSFIIADPARRYSRLGESDVQKLQQCLPIISGVMIHFNCENQDYDKFDTMLSFIEQQYGAFLAQLDWVSLGGGIHFTGHDYPLEQFAQRLKIFSEKYGVQIYLEPGEASITETATLETTVLDIVHNEKTTAILDSSIEAHLLDLLIYRSSAKLYAVNGVEVNLKSDEDGETFLCGHSCLAGDIFGCFKLPENIQLKIGDRISIFDVAGYSMVKKNWFNGVNMPSIVAKRLDGSLFIKTFDYTHFKSSLS